MVPSHSMRRTLCSLLLCVLVTVVKAVTAATNRTCSCVPGAFCDGITGACTNCPAGTFWIQSGVCAPCPRGRHQPMTGAVTCESCLPGRYENDPSSAEKSCKSCAKGRYQDAVAQHECKNCEPGQFSATAGAPRCAECSRGSMALSTQDGCLACPRFGVECENGQIALKRGFWFDYDKLSNGVLAKEENATISQLWEILLNNDTYTLHRCANGGKACSHSNKTHATAQRPSCALGHSGVLCAQCEASFYREIDGSCAPCPQHKRIAINFGATIVLIAILWYSWRKHLRPKVKHDLQWEKVPEVLKLLVGMIQVLQSFVTTLISVPWPPKLLEILRTLSNVNVFGNPPFIACYSFANTAYKRFLWCTSLTLGVVIAFKLLLSWSKRKSRILLQSRCRTQRQNRVVRQGSDESQNEVEAEACGAAQVMGSNFSSGDDDAAEVSDTSRQDGKWPHYWIQCCSKRAQSWKRSTIWTFLFLFLFLVYPSVSRTVIAMFVCDDVDGARYLKIDYGVRCDDAEYATVYYPLAIIFTLLFPVGILIFFGRVLYTHRDYVPHDWWGTPEDSEETKMELYNFFVAGKGKREVAVLKKRDRHSQRAALTIRSADGDSHAQPITNPINEGQGPALPLEVHSPSHAHWAAGSAKHVMHEDATDDANSAPGANTRQGKRQTLQRRNTAHSLGARMMELQEGSQKLFMIASARMKTFNSSSHRSRSSTYDTGSDESERSRRRRARSSESSGISGSSHRRRARSSESSVSTEGSSRHASDGPRPLPRILSKISDVGSDAEDDAVRNPIHTTKKSAKKGKKSNAEQREVIRLWNIQNTVNKKVHTRFGFLLGDYKKKYYWFECVMTLYKLLMTAIVVFVAEGTTMRILFSMTIAALLLTAMAVLQPYKDRRILQFEVVILFSILVVLMSGLLLDLVAKMRERNDQFRESEADEMADFAFYVGRVLLIFAVLPLAYALRLTCTFIKEATTEACSVGAIIGPCCSKRNSLTRVSNHKNPYSVKDHVRQALNSAREKQKELEQFVHEYSYLERYTSQASSAIEGEDDENYQIQRNSSSLFVANSSGRNSKTGLMDSGSNPKPHGTV